MAYFYGNQLLPSTENQSHNGETYITTLFGQRIQENPVPEWTADNRPLAVFQDPKTHKRIGISKDTLSCGLITLAEPGAGKTNLLNIITDRLLASQECNDKIIIFDTKGDYYREFGSRVPRENCIVISTNSEYRDLTRYHNIFAELMPRGLDGRLVYTEQAEREALEKAKQLFANMQSESQPIFPAMAHQIIAGLLCYYMKEYWRTQPDKLNNKDFVSFVLGSTNDEMKAVFEKPSMKDFRRCISYISGSGNQTQGVNSYVGTVLGDLFFGPFAMHDPKREFSMREVIDLPGKNVVFIEYDLRWGASLEPMYGLLMDSALANALGGRQTVRNNIYFILDEMLLLPQLKHLSNALNFGRSQNVRILCGLQNYSGLADLYGDIGAKRILASFQTLVCFRNSDYPTRSFLVDRFGENYTNISISPQQKNLNIQRESHTVEEWDILSLKFGEAIIKLKDEKPFFFTMPKYR